jgi:hypothetical protein
MLNRIHALHRMFYLVLQSHAAMSTLSSQTAHTATSGIQCTLSPHIESIPYNAWPANPLLVWMF